MASLINKARDKIEATLERSSNKSDNPQSTNVGPHSSNAMNKADPRVDSDADHRNDPTSRVGGYGQTQNVDHYGTTQGPGGITSTDTYGSRTNDPGYNNPHSANAGPHSSNIMNKMDPRVDSDRDHRNDPMSRVGGVGHTQHHGDGFRQSGGPGGIATTDTSYGVNPGVTSTTTSGYGAPVHDNTTHGHHGHHGYHGHGHASHTTTGPTGGFGGAAPIGSEAYPGTSHTYDDPRSTNAGPHSSNIMNKVDPRVDSDRDHRNDPTSRVGGYGTQTGGYNQHASGQGGLAAAAGTTSSYGAGHTAGAPGGYEQSSYTPGSGTATNTAGPHNSNILNKLDPRVDSDLDGSKTFGGNQTHR